MTASLTVLSGSLAGKRLDIDGSADEVLVGSDPDCGLALDLPGVSPIHARVSLDQGELFVHDTRSARGVFVNDDRVEGEVSLRDGDVLWLGPPGDPDSVMLQCRLGTAAAPADEAAMFATEGSPYDGLEAPVEEEPAAIVDTTDPMGDLGDLLAAAPEEPAAPTPEAAPPPPAPAAAAPPAEVPAPAMPVAAPPSPAPAEPPAEDVFFMEEPAAMEEPPAPAAPAPPPPAPPAPTPDDLFFVEEPAAPEPPPVPAVVPTPPAPAPRPPAAAPPAAPAPSATPAPRPAAPAAPATTRPPASAGSSAAPPRPVRRPGPTPPPSAALESDDAPAPRPRSVPPRAAAPAPARRKSGPPVALLAGGAGLVVLAVLAGVFALRSKAAPAIQSISPPRVGLGQSVTITGTSFAATPAGNVVQFAGKAGRVVQASATRLQVEIPEIDAAPGRDTPVPVIVIVEGRESKPATVGVFLAPRIHGIAPTVAMPGDEVVLQGAGWGAGATVEFGSVAATVLDSSPTSIKVTVPALEGAPGTEFPVRVAMGADTSNPAPFLLGRLPLIVSVTPAAAAPGDVVTLAGRGFDARPSANTVRIGGLRALVASSTSTDLKVVVPRVPAGEAAVELRVPGTDNVGQSKLFVAAGPDPIDFRFVAEPFEDQPGHDHAQLSTGLGPAFVLSASGGRSAAERALEAERRLNEAAAALRASIDTDVRARGLDASPSLVLIGKDTPLFDVTPDDAAAYDEDWTGLKGRGGPVTPVRLAVWWEAVARDLVALLVRGDKPHVAADLAAEGRVFADLHPLARKAVTAGVPREVIADARPAVRDALRTAGLRVPASVKGPVSASPVETAPVAVAAAGPVLKLDGNWSGTETESGSLKYITVTFSGAAGSLTYQRALAITVPVREVVQQKASVHFLVNTGSGPRYYQGKWDGQKLTGTLSVDPAGKSPVGTFELTPS